METAFRTQQSVRIIIDDRISGVSVRQVSTVVLADRYSKRWSDLVVLLFISTLATNKFNFEGYLLFERTIRIYEPLSQCGPQKLNNDGMYMVQNGSHTYLTRI